MLTFVKVENFQNPFSKISIFKSRGSKSIGIRDALLPEDDLREGVEAFVPDVNIEETHIPFCAVAVEFISGKLLVLSDGDFFYQR